MSSQSLLAAPSWLWPPNFLPPTNASCTAIVACQLAASNPQQFLYFGLSRNMTRTDLASAVRGPILSDSVKTRAEETRVDHVVRGDKRAEEWDFCIAGWP